MIKKSVSFDCIADKYYSAMTESELSDIYKKLLSEYEDIKKLGLKLDMSRGKPSPEQLDLSSGILTALKTANDCKNESGVDMRNYGFLAGADDARRLFGELCGVPSSQVIAGGSSSLNMMYDTVVRAMLFGVCGSAAWKDLEKVKFLCPCPGYDRHFAICEALGIEMINIEMKDDGPDMDEVERLVSSDESIKGIWCVPKFSNPTGIVYSEETIRRFAELRPAAKDFRIFWDNAYCVHDLYPEEAEPLPDILSLCEQAGSPDLVYEFCSTSKAAFPGAGISGVAASAANLIELRRVWKFATIGPDKLNQLRQARFFRNTAGLKAHMARHADLLRPKFERVEAILKEDLARSGAGSWTEPKGGYFISFNTLPGCAARTVELCKKAGVKFTPAGATWPCGRDPEDRNIRLAPSYASLEEIELAVRLFTICVRLAALESLASMQVGSADMEGERIA